MSVYVDQPRRAKRSARWHFPWACHLVADSLDELIEFAPRIGLDLAWMQSEKLPHFDVTKSGREQAINLGAIPVGMTKIKELIRRYRRLTQ